MKAYDRSREPAHIGRRPGFSLVEVMVVIAIILVLVALLAPLITRIQVQSKAVKCISNIRQLGIAMRLYASNNRDAYPINVSSPTPYHWDDAALLGTYLSVPNSPMNSASAYWCPTDLDAQRSYSMNIWASSKVDKSVASLTTGALWPRHRVATGMLLLADSWSYQSGIGTGYITASTIGAAGLSAGQRFGSLGGISPIPAGRWGPINCELAYARHRIRGTAGGFTQPIGRISIFFDDGHAALCSDTDLIDPKTGQSSGLAAWSTLDYLRN